MRKMSKEDLIYALILILSLIFSYIVKLITNPSLKRSFVCFCGIFTAILTCGHAFIHSFITIVVNLFIIRFCSAKYIHIFSFLWCFSYLTFFRVSHYFGFPPPVAYLNAIQLFNTLRMVGLAFEMRDYYKEEALKSEQRLETSRIINDYIDKYNTREYQNCMARPSSRVVYCLNRVKRDPNYFKNNYNLKESNTNIRQISEGIDGNCNVLKNHVWTAYREVTFSRLFSYSYCFIGLMTGPYYTYKTYDDMVNNRNSRRLNNSHHLFSALKYLPFCIIIFLIINHLYSLDTVRAPSFGSSPLSTRLSYMVIMFAMFRARLYIAWLLSEAVCVVSCLGIYPITSQPRTGSGPTNLMAYYDWLQWSDEEKLHAQYNFEAIRNLDIYGCELSPTMRQGMRSWNRSVQYWLASFVHKRLPFKIPVLRVALTMLVSAYWHGIHAGYFLSFLLMPFYLMHEDLMAACFKRSRWAKSLKALDRFNKLTWFLKMRLFEYTSMGFLLLKYYDTSNYWRGIGFWGHLFIPVSLGMGLLWRSLQWLTSRTHVATEVNVVSDVGTSGVAVTRNYGGVDDAHSGAHMAW